MSRLAPEALPAWRGRRRRACSLVGDAPAQLAPVRAVGEPARLAEELEDLLPAAVLARRRAPTRRRARRRPRRSPRRARAGRRPANASKTRRMPSAPSRSAVELSSALERRHRQPVRRELRVVELRELPVPRPDHRLPVVVDLVRELHPPVVVDAGDRLRERERDALERVVVVVQDDHAPRVAGAGAPALRDALPRWGDR